MRRYQMKRAKLVGFCSVMAVTFPPLLSVDIARAEQPDTPCHANPNAAADRAAVAGRADVVDLPQELTMVRSVGRPAAYLSAIAGVRRSR